MTPTQIRLLQKSYHRRIYFAAALTLVFFSYGVFKYISIEEKLQHSVEASRIQDQLKNEIKSGYDVLNNLTALFNASIEDVDFDGFRIVTEPALEQSQFIRSVSFSQWVPGAEFALFEKKIQAKGWPSYQIHGSSEVKLAFYKNHALPIVFYEPLTPIDGGKLGLDLMSETDLSQGIVKSVENAKVAILNQSGIANNLQVIELIKPVYSGKAIPMSVPARWESLVGILRISIDTKKLISKIAMPANFEIEIGIPSLETEKSSIKGIKDTFEKPSILYSIGESESDFYIDGGKYNLKVTQFRGWSLGKILAYLLVFLLVLIATTLAKLRINLFFKDYERESLQKELEIQLAISEESNKVKIMVDNMQQALFSIVAGGKIVEPVSKYSNTIFGKDIVGDLAANILFGEMIYCNEQFSKFNSALDIVFGEDQMQWSLMIDNFPEKIKYRVTTADGFQERTIKIKVTPVWNESFLLDKILVVGDDITQFELLEVAINEQHQQAAMMEDILSNSFDQLGNFFIAVDEVLASCAEPNLQSRSQSLLEILRHLHTLKGNSRTFKLRSASIQIHDSENILFVLNNSNPDESRQLVIQNELTKIKDIFDKYKSMMVRFTQPLPQASHQESINLAGIAAIGKSINYLNEKYNDIELLNLKQMLQTLFFKSTKYFFTKYESMVHEVAKEIGKKVIYSIEGEIFLPENYLVKIGDCALHLIRNSLDHGIENPQERRAAGKQDAGLIKIKCFEVKDFYTIVVEDDGRGIDVDSVTKMAVEKGLINPLQVSTLSASDKINIILAPNFSIKTEVTEISGRGIGMSVVVELVTSMGGELSIASELGKGSSFSITFLKSMIVSTETKDRLIAI